MATCDAWPLLHCAWVGLPITLVLLAALFWHLVVVDCWRWWKRRRR